MNKLLKLFFTFVFFAFSVSVVNARCTGCSSAGCGSCSSTSNGWRCSCSGYSSTTRDYATCSGVQDSSCSKPAPTAVPTARPTAVPTARPTAVPCNTTCPSGKTHKTECPSGTVESNCSAISQPSSCTSTYTCCNCVAAPPTATPTPSTCTRCETAECGSCSTTTDGWRCRCSGNYNGKFTSCSGVADSGCKKAPPTPTPVEDLCAMCSITNCGECAANGTGFRCECKNPRPGGLYTSCKGVADSSCAVPTPFPTEGPGCEHANCEGKCGIATPCTPSGSCGQLDTPNLYCNGVHRPHNGCRTPSGCKSSPGDVWTSTPPPAGVPAKTCTPQCSCCGNYVTTCYQYDTYSCSGTCFAPIGNANTCAEFNNLYPKFIYESAGTCAPPNVCCTKKDRPCPPEQPCASFLLDCGDNNVLADNGACGKKICQAPPKPPRQEPPAVLTECVMLDDGQCGKYQACPPVISRPPCPARQNCPTNSGYTGGYVSNGDCTDRWCPPIAVSCGPVDGGWSGWSGCSANCGQPEIRSCNNPSPSCGGSNCSGSGSRNCSDSDTGNPARTTIVSPAGSPSNPVVYSNIPIVPLVWTRSSDPKANAYNVRVWDPVGTQVFDVNIDQISSVNAYVNASALRPNTLYHWQVNVLNTRCATMGTMTTYSSGWSEAGYFRVNNGPGLDSLTIVNDAGTTVPPETGNRNQICQTEFTGRNVTFIVNAFDSDGNSDISSIQLRVAGATHSPTSLSNGVGIFRLNYPVSAPTNNSNIEVTITDGSGTSTGWINSGRMFRVWNCAVAVSGTFYDGTGAPFDIIDCASSSTSFTNPIDSAIAYNLNYKSNNPLVEKQMTVNSPTYNSGANSLYWGLDYLPLFGNFDGSSPSMRVPGMSTCQASLNLNNSIVDPYSNNPAIVVDFSSIVNNFPWFQAAGGGVIAKNSITDNIPAACTEECKASISRSTDKSESGIVSARTISKGSGNYSESENWNTSRDLIGAIKNYKYFYNEYYAKLGEGKVINETSTMSNVKSKTGGKGVVFVNGNLNIDTDHILNPGDFLMLIVKGDINIAASVSRIDGILISDNNINITDKSDNQLNIQGSIYSKNNINFTRGFVTGTLNNKNPSVLVTYRPDFVFSMPGKLTKVLSGWREGI